MFQNLVPYKHTAKKICYGVKVKTARGLDYHVLTANIARDQMVSNMSLELWWRLVDSIMNRILNLPNGRKVSLIQKVCPCHLEITYVIQEADLRNKNVHHCAMQLIELLEEEGISMNPFIVHVR